MRLSNYKALAIGQSFAVTNQKEPNHWLILIPSTRHCHGEATGNSRYSSNNRKNALSYMPMAGKRKVMGMMGDGCQVVTIGIWHHFIVS
jgi:hypothetical protein